MPILFMYVCACVYLHLRLYVLAFLHATTCTCAYIKNIRYNFSKIKKAMNTEYD